MTTIYCVSLYSIGSVLWTGQNVTNEGIKEEEAVLEKKSVIVGCNKVKRLVQPSSAGGERMDGKGGGC
jgi:hypothetical protein